MKGRSALVSRPPQSQTPALSINNPNFCCHAANLGFLTMEICISLIQWISAASRSWGVIHWVNSESLLLILYVQILEHFSTSAVTCNSRVLELKSSHIIKFPILTSLSSLAGARKVCECLTFFCSSPHSSGWSSACHNWGNTPTQPGWAM